MADNFNDIEKAEENLSKKISEEKRDLFNLEIENIKKKKLALKLSLYVQIFAILFAILIIYNRYPELNDSAAQQRPLRIGTYSNDEKTEECLKNIWVIMADKKAKLFCPASNQPYIIKDKSVFCPNPQKHGHKKIYSKNGKIPRIE